MKWLALTVSLLLPAWSPGEVEAQGKPVYLWGIQAGCAPRPADERDWERALRAMGASLLRGPDGGSLPVCEGSACGRALAAMCPGVEGVLLGAQVAVEKSVMRTRVWSVDLSSGRVAYRDDYCHHCERTLGKTLGVHASALLASPAWGERPGKKPGYCASGLGTGAVGPVVVVVVGEGKHQGAIEEGLRVMVAAKGRQVVKPSYEPKTLAGDELERLAGPQAGSQVLAAQVSRDRTVHLYLYDGASKRDSYKHVKCEGAGCELGLFAANATGAGRLELDGYHGSMG